MFTVPPWFFRPTTGFLVLAFSLMLLTAVLAPLVDGGLLPVALAYLLIALVCAAVWGWVVGIVAAVAANLVFNLFFVEPLHDFTVDEADDAAGLAMFLAVSAIGAGMLSLFRRQLAIARAARAEADMLLAVSRDVAEGITPRDALDRLCGSIARAVGAASCAILRADDTWRVIGTTGGLGSLSRGEQNLASQSLAARSTVVSRQGSGAESQRGGEPPTGSVSFVPVLTGPGAPCVIRLAGDLRASTGISLQRLLDAFKDEVSVAVNRAELQGETAELDRLKQADDLKTALLSSVSHDLRTPLTAIKAAAGALSEEDGPWLPEDRELFLQTIQEQTERLTATVDGLLEMSRLEGGAVQLDLEFIEVRPLLEEVLQAARPSLVDRCTSVVSEEPVWVRADYRLLFQAVQNLVENAAKHTGPGGEIILGAMVLGGNVRVWVEDNGPGIAPADLPHIFEKFYRGGGEAQAMPGLGLGLSIVKAMVELNRGTVSAEPVDGGTRFVVELPAAPAPR